MLSVSSNFIHHVIKARVSTYLRCAPNPINAVFGMVYLKLQSCQFWNWAFTRIIVIYALCTETEWSTHLQSGAYTLSTLMGKLFANITNLVKICDNESLNSIAGCCAFPNKWHSDKVEPQYWYFKMTFTLELL